MTWLPAPMAYSISVAVGDSETIEPGRAGMCTVPPAVLTVTGNAAAAGEGLTPAVSELAAELVHAAAVNESAAAARTAGS